MQVQSKSKQSTDKKGMGVCCKEYWDVFYFPSWLVWVVHGSVVGLETRVSGHSSTLSNGCLLGYGCLLRIGLKWSQSHQFHLSYDSWILLGPLLVLLLLLLLSHFSCIWLCVTPYMVAHQAPPSLGFSRQEHWSGLPLPSPWNAIKSFLELRLPLFSEWYSLLWPKSLLGNEVVAKSR